MFLFGSTTSDSEKLKFIIMARYGTLHLTDAPYAPPGGGSGFPPGQLLFGRAETSLRFISIQELAHIPNSSHSPRPAEPPGPHANVPQIFKRVAHMWEFPIKNSSQARFIHHEVSHAEIAMDQGPFWCRIGFAAGQFTQP